MKDNGILQAREQPLFCFCKKRCSSYYELIIKTLVFITLIATAISFFGVFTVYLNLNYTCRRVVRQIEITGEVTNETTSLFNTLKSNTNIGSGSTMSVSAKYYKDKKIQLRDTFTVTCSASYSINIFTPTNNSPVGIDIPLKVRLAGMSEKFSK